METTCSQVAVAPPISPAGSTFLRVTLRASHRSRISRQLYGNAFRWDEWVDRFSSATRLFRLALPDSVLSLLDIKFAFLYIECMTKTVNAVPDDAPMTMTLDERSAS